MWKIFQDKTVFNDGHGNCYAACMASMMELRLSEVPSVLPGKDQNFHHVWDEFLTEKGLRLHVVFPNEKCAPPKGYSMATVLTKRVYPAGHPNAGNKIFHCVVMFDGQLVHDPYPFGSEITEISHYEYLVPLGAQIATEDE